MVKLSQHFLVDREVVDLIRDMKFERPLIEVGGGYGALTREIEPDMVIELDRYLAKSISSWNVVIGDGRSVPFVRGTIISSLPYHITYEFFREVNSLNGIRKLLLILQRDFVEKILVVPTYLSFMINFLYNIRVIRDIPPSSFNPSPKVMSTVVLLERVRVYDERIDSLLRCISNYRNKTIRRASAMCGVVSECMERVESIAPPNVLKLLKCVGYWPA